MAAGTRSLPTDLPVPYFQPLERGHVSEGVPSDIGVLEGALHEVCRYHPTVQILMYFPICPLVVLSITLKFLNRIDSLSTLVLMIMITLFEARHGRGAIDSVPKSDDGVLAVSTMVMPTTTSSMGMTENIMTGARPKHTPESGHLPPIQRGLVSVREIPSTTEHKAVSPMSTGHILGDGSAIFTGMTGIMLTALDQQMAISDKAQKPEGSLLGNLLIPGQVASHGNIEDSKIKPLPDAKVDSRYPDLYLLVAEN